MSRRPSTLLLVALLALAGQSASAQRLAASASIGVNLRLLPVASFEGGPVHTLAVLVEPGVTARIEPRNGVHTRLTYNAATRVTARTSSLRGPDGATVVATLLCMVDSGSTSAATESFDCDAGHVATIVDGRATTISLAIGAVIEKSATRGVPPGLYTGQMTLTAAPPTY